MPLVVSSTTVSKRKMFVKKSSKSKNKKVQFFCWIVVQSKMPSKSQTGATKPGVNITKLFLFAADPAPK